MLWASAVAVLHGAAIAVMVGGALLALRRPWLLLVHAPVATAILAVHLAGAPCPLTDLELALRERVGAAQYADGFLGHYVFDPMGLDVAAPSSQAGIYAVAIVPNVVAYGLLAARSVRRRQQASRERSVSALRTAWPYPSLLKYAYTSRPAAVHSRMRSAHQRRSASG